MDDYVLATMEAPTAAGSSDAWVPAKLTRLHADHGLKRLLPPGRGNSRPTATTAPVPGTGEAKDMEDVDAVDAADVAEVAETSRAGHNQLVLWNILSHS